MRCVPWVAAVIVFSSLRALGQETAPATQGALDGAWKDLGSSATKETRALLTFQDHPGEAVAFFQSQLRPLTLTEEELKPLLEALGSDDDSVWKPAYEKLRYFDPRMAMSVEALDEQASAEPMRHRMFAILVNTDPKNLEGQTFRLEHSGDDYILRSDNSGWQIRTNVAGLGSTSKQTWRRAAEALTLLRSIGSPEALELLKAYAAGNAEMSLTKLARKYVDEGSAPTTQADMVARVEGWWADLAVSDEKSAAATLEFGRRPELAISFFEDELKPLTITADDVRAALADLGSDDEKRWKPAFEKLEHFDPRLAIDVKTLFDETTDGTARARLAAILLGRPVEEFAGKEIEIATTSPDHMEVKVQQGNNTSFWYLYPGVSHVSQSGWLRAERAIVIVSHIGTPVAEALLQRMAGGNPEAAPTKTAVAELKRLEGGR